MCYVHNTPRNGDVMTRTRGDLFKVRDAPALAMVGENIVAMRGEGFVSHAAKNIGVSRSTLTRILFQNKPTLTRATAIALGTAAKSIDNDLVNRFHNALISPDAMRIFREGYQAWVRERFARFEERDGPSWRIYPSGTVASDPAQPLQLAANRRQLIQGIWRIAHAEFSDVFAAFRDEMVRRHVERERQEVAVLRVLEPLLEASQSGYVERSWSELSAKERRDFIDAGIKREMILLNREPALARATRIATEGAHTFAREAAAAT